MKSMADKTSIKKNGFQSDDDGIRYKLNREYFNKLNKVANVTKKLDKLDYDDENIRYRFPTVLTKPKVEQKPKPKPKIKVNFWSNKQTGSRLHNNEVIKNKVNRRHTVAAVSNDAPSAKPKSSVRVRKQVSFLPSPLFSDNHVPMVTVPDDLTIHLNEEEANDLRDDLNSAFVNNENRITESSKRNSKTSTTQTSPKSNKRKRSLDDSDPRNQSNEHELEFFTKYVVQKLRKMETNQRIYSENLIHTVLMLGQLGKLNGKSKIAEP